MSQPSARMLADGDVTAHPLLTHLAGVHGGLAASNAVLDLRRKVAVTPSPVAAAVAGTIHPCPTYGGGMWNAAIDVVRAHLAAAITRSPASTLVGPRRRWTTRRRGAVRS